MSLWGRGAESLAVLLVSSALLIAGCGGTETTTADSDSSPTEGGTPELVVFGAASLGPAFEEFGDTFEDADVKYSFAGSDDLAAQIRQGVVPDVYAAANTALPDELFDEGLVGKPETFVTNKLVVGVPAGSDIDDVAGLEASGVSIAIGDEEVPVGSYTREVLDTLGPDASKAILDNVESSEPDVSGIVGKLTQGAVDAGFVYQSDVDASGGKIDAVLIPESASPDIAYGIAPTADPAQPELARDFVDSMVGGDGQDVLLESGFGPPPSGS